MKIQTINLKNIYLPTMKISMTLLLLMLVVFSSCVQQQKEAFHFYVATDPHMIMHRDENTSLCFRDDVLPSMKNDSAGIGKFIVVTGDMDPFINVKESVEEVLGKEFRFYPVLGNHDVGMTNNQYKKYPEGNWGDTFDIVTYNRNKLKNIANYGPSYLTPALDNIVYNDSISGKEFTSTYDSLDVIGSKYTTYSFDEGNAHFIILDIYSGLQNFEARHKGRISNALFNWVADDLAKTTKENIFVFAHQPIWNDTGEGKESLVNEAYRNFCKKRSRKYEADSLIWFKKEYNSKIKSRQEFWDLLVGHNVTAYFCGHTHHYAAKKYAGVWEVNLEFSAWSVEGRTRYAKVFVDGEAVKLKVMGYKGASKEFELIETINLKDKHDKK